MRMMRSALIGTAVLLACVTTARAEDAAQIADRLHRVETLNSIDDPALKPWHLKLSFQLFDAKGKPSEQGAVEEWWRSPSSYKIVYTSPSYTATSIESSDGLYRSKGASSPPYLLDKALNGIVHPLALDENDQTTPELRQQKFGKVPLDCIMLSIPIKRVAFAPLGLFPTFCLDRDKDSLRASYDFGTDLTIRNSIGMFQQRDVPIDQSITVNSINAISTHIEVLRGESMPDAEFQPSADLEDVTRNFAQVPSGVIAGRILNKIPPIYPERAKANRATGSVVMHATIGTDGHIHALKLISVPDPDLAIAAVSAVRQWTYRPYTLNGVPVGVSTTITVNFNMSP